MVREPTDFVYFRDSSLEREIEDDIDVYDALPPVSENRGGGTRSSSVSDKALASKGVRRQAESQAPWYADLQETYPYYDRVAVIWNKTQADTKLNITGTNTQSYAAFVKLGRQPCPSIH